jgi:hypothetical protein
MSFPWLADLPVLSNDSFSWPAYRGDNSWLIDGDNSELPKDWTPIGKINGDDLIIRPRPGTAVLFEDDNGERFWQHVTVEPYKA